MKRMTEERGSVAVVVTLFLTAAMGFMALSIDRGNWLADKRSDQNAVDAAAMAAAEVYYASEPYSANLNAAKAKGVEAANFNLDADHQITEDQLVLTPVVSEGKMKAQILNPSDNYFMTAVNGSDKTLVYTEATAAVVMERIARANASIECGDDFLWSGGNGCTTEGGIIVGGTATITSGIHVKNGPLSNGDLSADGISTHIWNGVVTLQPCTDVIIDGNVYSNGKISITWPIKVNGSMYATDGSIEWNSSSGGRVSGVIKSTENVNLNYSNVTYGGKADHQVNLPDVKYEWKWDDIDDCVEEGNVVQVTQALFDQYKATDRFVDGSISCWGEGNFEFKINSKFGDFVSFCREKALKGKDTPVYFPGSVTFNQCEDQAYEGMVICENDITMNVKVNLSNPSSAALVSRHGNITLGNSGTGNTCNGAVVVMDENKHLQLNGDGSVTGGLISHGSITMNGTWNVYENEDWQKVVPGHAAGARARLVD